MTWQEPGGITLQQTVIFRGGWNKGLWGTYT